MREKNLRNYAMNSGEEKYKVMLSGYIDGELSPEEQQELEQHLKTCPECREELRVFQQLKEVTGAMKYADIPEHVWDNYWRGIYRRMELSIGWILFSIGAVIVIACACYGLCKDFFLNPEEPIILRIGFGALILGAATLLVSVTRERIFAYRRDRYKEIKR